MSKSSAKLLPAGTVLLTTRATIGECSISTTDCATNQGFQSLIPNRDITSDFCYYLAQTKKKEMITKASGSTFLEISNSEIKGISAVIPEISEQKHISGFLSLLDRKIEKQRQFVELLKSYKRGVIEHYFSKQITLTSSGEIWRKCLIKDCLYYEQPQKYIVKSEQYSNSYPIPVLTANKAFILGYTNEIDGIYDKGQVIIYDDFTMETKFVEFPFKVKSSTIKMLTPKNGNNLYFLFCLLQHLRLKPEGHQRSYISIVEAMDVSIPSVNEQNYTAELFYTLNRLVECEEDNLTHFEKEKASLLQQMFI